MEMQEKLISRLSNTDCAIRGGNFNDPIEE